MYKCYVELNKIAPMSTKQVVEVNNITYDKMSRQATCTDNYGNILKVKAEDILIVENAYEEEFMQEHYKVI